MRAAVMTAEKTPLSIEELEPIGLGDHDIIIETRASGLCHSDLLPLQGLIPGRHAPQILGHEGAGVVTEVGAAVTRVRPGEKVIASWVASCGHCYWCSRGQANLCGESWDVPAPARLQRPDGTPIPAASGLGTHSEAMVTSERSAVKVETDLPFEQLALIGCGVTTGVGAVINTARVEPGSSVVILGAGGVGQSAIQGARIAGASRIICVDPIALKREMAVKIGATDVVDPGAGDPVEQVRELTAGRGSDYAFETAGRSDTAGQGFEMIRRGGTLTLVGAQPPQDPIPWGGFTQMFLEKRVLGCLYGSAQLDRDFPRLIGLVEAGKLDLDSMISRRFTLDQVNEGLDAIESGSVIRSVIVN